MEAIFSDLKFDKYYILNSRLSTKFYKGANLSNVKKKIHQRAFDIEFDVLDEENSDNFIIDLDINSFSENKNKKLSGYDFHIKVRAFFSLTNKKNVDEDKEFRYVFYSALPMVISLCRSHLSLLTVNGIFGAYTLPAIDLQQLVNDWLDNAEENEE